MFKRSSNRLSLVLLSWLLLLLATPSPVAHVGADQSKNDVFRPSVIVVGAGMSGIMAAKTLAENGVEDFLILEATDRIGGRMHKVDFAGYTVELGANWVEGVGGEKENPIWKLAKEYDLRVVYSDFDNVSFNTYDQEGHYLPQSVVAAPFNLAAASYNYSNTLGTSLLDHGEEDISILCSQRLFGHEPTTPLDMAIDYFNYDFEIAEPPRVTSLKNVQPNPTFTVYGETEYFVADKRGYEYIVHRLAARFLKVDGENVTDPRLKLNKVVREIKHSSHGVKISTEDGSVYTAKFAIISVSLGVLQSKLIKFMPDLPQWKIKTIYQFDMSIYTKIFMKFPHKFWPTGHGTEFFLYADEKRGYYPFWQHLESELPGSHILFVTVTDDESRRIEQQPDSETQEEAMVVLRKLFGKGIPNPERILVPRWWTNRYYRGSYLNWPIGITEADFDRMKAPVGSIYFTGEHASSKFNGYVHGAYLEGIATANALLDCIKKQKCAEITSDGYPWGPKSKTQTCKGSCCAELQKERENMRQAWSKKVDILEEALHARCQP